MVWFLGGQVPISHKRKKSFSEFTTRTQWSICTFLQVSWQKTHVFCNYFAVLLQFSWQKKNMCFAFKFRSFPIRFWNVLRILSLISILGAHGKSPYGSRMSRVPEVLGDQRWLGWTRGLVITPRNTPFIRIGEIIIHWSVHQGRNLRMSHPKATISPLILTNHWS